jgi:hypothetical protein
MNPPGRRIYTLEPTRCGICNRPVELISGRGLHFLYENSAGWRYPHTCPTEAVEAWRRRDAIRRIKSRTNALGLGPRPGLNPDASVPCTHHRPMEEM